MTAMRAIIGMMSAPELERLKTIANECRMEALSNAFGGHSRDDELVVAEHTWLIDEITSHLHSRYEIAPLFDAFRADPDEEADVPF